MKGSDIAKSIDEEYRKQKYYKDKYKKIKGVTVKNGTPIIEFEEVKQNT